LVSLSTLTATSKSFSCCCRVDAPSPIRYLNSVSVNNYQFVPRQLNRQSANSTGCLWKQDILTVTLYWLNLYQYKLQIHRHFWMPYCLL